jgi:hypothetical protein
MSINIQYCCNLNNKLHELRTGVLTGPDTAQPFLKFGYEVNVHRLLLQMHAQVNVKTNFS